MANANPQAAGPNAGSGGGTGGAQPLLSVRNLSLDFGSPKGRVHALRDVSLEVPKGRIVGIVGDSGCGKSTLASWAGGGATGLAVAADRT